MTIGKRIKDRRQELKISQRELASKLGYSDHTTLTRIESDKVNLSETRIKQLASVLDVSVGYLMGWKSDPEQAGSFAASVLTDMGLQKLLQDYMALSDDDQYLVNTLVGRLAEKEKANHKASLEK